MFFFFGFLGASVLHDKNWRENFQRLLIRKTISNFIWIVQFGFIISTFRLGIRAGERGGEAVIFTGARHSKGAQESEIYLILSHILLFWDIKSVKLFQISGLMLKSSGEYETPKLTKENFTGARPFSLRPCLYSCKF
jgi:hypothetical protein